MALFGEVSSRPYYSKVFMGHYGDAKGQLGCTQSGCRKALNRDQQMEVVVVAPATTSSGHLWTPSFKRQTRKCQEAASYSSLCSHKPWSFGKLLMVIMVLLPRAAASAPITSVGITVPPDLTAAGSPLTSSGTITLGHSGQTCSTTACTVSSGVVIADASAKGATVNLPVANQTFNPIEICKSDSSANGVTIAANGTDKVGGASTVVLSQQNQCVKLADTGVGSWTLMHSGPVSAYSGPISVTGTGLSGNPINNSSINSTQNVMAYGAACDGVTDDTAAFNRTIAAAGNGGVVLLPPNSQCEVTNLTFKNTITGLTVTTGAYNETPDNAASLEFTGTPGPCSAGSGGLLLVSGYSLRFTQLKLYEKRAGTNSSCFINVSMASPTTTARVTFDHDLISGPPGAATQAFFLSRTAQFTLDSSYINDGVFSQWVVEDIAANGFNNVVSITNNRFGALTFAQTYHYGIDLNLATSSGASGTQALSIIHNTLEQDPNLIRIGAGEGVTILNNWAKDRFPIATWAGANGTNLGCGTNTYCANTCVTPTNYSAASYVFCTSALCTPGAASKEPAWGTAPGGTTVDNTCKWTNEGAGIGMDLTGTGTVADNHWGSGGAIELKTESSSSLTGWDIRGNYISTGHISELLNNASGSSIEANNIFDTAVDAIAGQSNPGLAVIGDGTTTVNAVRVGPQNYSSGSGKNIPWLKLGANTHGEAFYDTSAFPPARFTDSSSNGWIIQDPGGSLTKSIGSTLLAGNPYLACAEGTAPTGASGIDEVWCDSTAHRMKMLNNNGASTSIIGASDDISSLTPAAAKYSMNSHKFTGLAPGTASGDSLAVSLNHLNELASATGNYSMGGNSLISVGNLRSNATNVAASGTIRDGNNTTIAAARNAANSADIALLGSDSFNRVTLGDSANAAELKSNNPLSLAAGASPTLTAGCSGSGSSVVAGSNDNRGRFITQSSAATTCTLTFNHIWSTAPACVFVDGSASVTPASFSAGATTTNTAVVDFSSTTSKKINYLCF